MSNSTATLKKDAALFEQLTKVIEQLAEKSDEASKKLLNIDWEETIISDRVEDVANARLSSIMVHFEQTTEKSKTWAEKIAEASQKVQDSFSKLNETLGGRLSLDALAKSAEDLQGLQKRIERISQKFCDSADGIYFLTLEANKARMAISEYGDAYVNLGKNAEGMLLSPKDVTDTLNAMSNALKLGTGSADEQSAALGNLIEEFSQGPIKASAMKTFLDNLSDTTLQALAKSMGKSEEGLINLAEQGKITGQSLNNGLIGISPTLQQSVDKLPMSWGTAVTKVSNRWDDLIFNLESRSGIITKISNLFIRGFDLAERAIYWFINTCGGVENAMTLIGVAIGLLSLGKILPFFTSLGSIFSSLSVLTPILSSVIKGLGIALRFLFSPAGLIIAAIIAIGLAIKDLYDWINGGDSVIGNFLGPWVDVKTKLIALWNEIKNKVTSIWDNVKNYFSTLWDDAINSSVETWESFKNYLNGLWNGIKADAFSKFDNIKTYLSTLWNNIVNTSISALESFTNYLDSLWSGIKADAFSKLDGIKKYFSTLWDNIVNTSTSALGSFKNYLNNLWTGIKAYAFSVWDGIKTYFSTLWDNIVNASTSALGSFKNYLNNLWAGIKAYAFSSWDSIKTYFSTLWDNIVNTSTSALGSFKNYLNNLWAGIKAYAFSVWDGIKTYFSTLWNNIVNTSTSALGSFKNYLDNLWTGIKAYAFSSWDSIKTYFSTLWDNIVNTAISAWETFTNYLSSLWEGIKSYISSTWDSITEYFFTLWNNIVNTAISVWDLFINYLNGLWTSIKTYAFTIWDEIKASLIGKWDEIVNSAITTWENLKNKITQLFDELKKHIEDVFTFDSTKLTKGFDSIFNGFNELVDGSKKIFDDFVKYLDGLATDIIAPFKSGIEGAKNQLRKIPGFSAIFGDDTPEESISLVNDIVSKEVMSGTSKLSNVPLQTNEKVLSQAPFILKSANDIVRSIDIPNISPSMVTNSTTNSYTQVSMNNTVNINVSGNATQEQSKDIENAALFGILQGSKLLMQTIEGVQS